MCQKIRISICRHLFYSIFIISEAFKLTQKHYKTVSIANNIKQEWLTMYQCISANISYHTMGLIIWLSKSGFNLGWQFSLSL